MEAVGLRSGAMRQCGAPAEPQLYLTSSARPGYEHPLLAAAAAAAAGTAPAGRAEQPAGSILGTPASHLSRPADSCPLPSPPLPAPRLPLPQVHFRHTVRYATDKQLFIAAEGLYSGQYIYCGKKATLNIGNVKPVGDMPEGTIICNVEEKTGDRGSLARCSGDYAIIVAHNPDANITRIKLPSGSKKVRACGGAASGGWWRGGGWHTCRWLAGWKAAGGKAMPRRLLRGSSSIFGAGRQQAARERMQARPDRAAAGTDAAAASQEWSGGQLRVAGRGGSGWRLVCFDCCWRFGAESGSTACSSSCSCGERAGSRGGDAWVGEKQPAAGLHRR